MSITKPIWFWDAKSCKFFGTVSSLDNVAYIGDGLVDIPVLDIVGCPISVPNAHASVKNKSIYITTKTGGDGVLYEVIEKILLEKNIYQDTIQIMKDKVYWLCYMYLY